MRVWVIGCLCALVLCGGADAAPGKAGATGSRKLGLVIRVDEGGWGDARKARIETVLYGVADTLISRLPRKMTAPIVVSHTDLNPITLYDRGHGGEYLVQLHATGERWYLYVYEFAHELCHILSNYDEHLVADRRRENQWFEETVCEAASLYALKRMASDWETSSDPELAAHARYLRGYYDLLVNQEHRRLPPQTTLSAWLARTERQLRNDPYQRKKNQLVANQLLPLFEEDAENWDAISYLNLEPGHDRMSLRDYLHYWYRHAPERHRPFVAGVVGLLDAIREGSPSARLLGDAGAKP